VSLGNEKKSKFFSVYQCRPQLPLQQTVSDALVVAVTITTAWSPPLELTAHKHSHGLPQRQPCHCHHHQPPPPTFATNILSIDIILATCKVD
jgi:hypothetical protein